MPRIASNFFISLDGVVEAPNKWHFPYFDDEMGRIIGRGVADQTGFLLGRRLYDEWSQFWPAQGPEVPFAQHINGTQKYVLTHRPVLSPLWSHTTVIGDDAVAQVRALKETGDGTVAMSGSATTARWLLREGLLDELALLVHPIAVGEGQRLFEGAGNTPLQLISSEALSTGVLYLRYQPA